MSKKSGSSKRAPRPKKTEAPKAVRIRPAGEAEEVLESVVDGEASVVDTDAAAFVAEVPESELAVTDGASPHAPVALIPPVTSEPAPVPIEAPLAAVATPEPAAPEPPERPADAPPRASRLPGLPHLRAAIDNVRQRVETRGASLRACLAQRFPRLAALEQRLRKS